MGHDSTKQKQWEFTLSISELRSGAAASTKTMSVLSVGGKGTTCLIRSDKVLRNNIPMTEKVVSPLGAGMAAAFIFLPMSSGSTVTRACSGEVPTTARMNCLREDNLLLLSAG